MYKNARENYLENAILSASPQQLRKMLIDGAIRFSRQAIENWNQKQFDKGLDCINKTRDIISEILATTKQLSEETKTIRQVYVFLLSEVTAASFERDVNKMQKVIDVLEVEQETWALVLQQLRDGGPAGQPGGPISRTDSPAASQMANPNVPPAAFGNGGSNASGFNFEA